MKFVHLSKDIFAVIDDEDYEEVSKYTWRVSQDFYATSSSREISDLRMHKLIIKGVRPPLMIDHINRVKLDNRRCNLRIVTASENARNKGVPHVQVIPSEEDKQCALSEKKRVRKCRYSSRDYSNHRVTAVTNITTGEKFRCTGDAAIMYNTSESNILRSCKYPKWKCRECNWKVT